MLTSIIAGIVTLCVRWRRTVIAAAAVLGLASAVYAAANFTVNTDTEQLLPSDLAWRQHQIAYAAVFPLHQIIAVVEAPTPELTDIAAQRLVASLQKRSDLFTAVLRPGGGEFTEKSALLYLPADQVKGTVEQLAGAGKPIGLLASDPTLHGVMELISAGAGLVQGGHLPASAMARPIAMLSATLNQVLTGHFASFSWRDLLAGKPSTVAERREFIEIDPKLDFKSVQPGHAATAAIRKAVEDLRLGPELGATVRLTGRVPINDANFSALGESAIPGLVGTVVAVLGILWLALRSGRLIGAVVATLAVGFAMTAAAGLLLVGAFNLLSIAFAVLFIGLGTDFALQFSVRYRAERHEHPEIATALRSAAERAGGPLALAAAGTMVGFFSFLPTQYRGVAELGEIAGVGMLIAFAVTITMLPALIASINPPPEPDGLGFAGLARADRFMGRHRIAIVVGTIVVVLAASPLLLRIRFDFDPIHLQNPKNPAVETYRDLTHVPELGINAVDYVASSVAAIPNAEQRVANLPEVAGTRSIDDLIPPDQDPKLAAIRAAAPAITAAVTPKETQPAASDADTVNAIRQAVADLEKLSGTARDDESAAAFQLARRLESLAGANPGVRKRAEAAFVLPLKRDLDRLRNMAAPEPVTVSSLPPAMARDWLSPDGRARIEVIPRGDPNDMKTLGKFADAVLAAVPEAAGSPIQLTQSELTVLHAFYEAGALALVAIGLILWVTLRRFGDVLLTLVPLLVAGAVTLELMGLIGAPLNFANVIALPLLLGVGVAFKIYYIMAWRAGQTGLLQSALTRAVVFSAATTATAFGSLWLSRDPGMSSMGGLMALALVCTLAAAVLFQPLLMGPPRETASDMPPAPPPLEHHPERREAAE
jgi:hopanoid biosynthesis associated RND transporter like protein HpnN